MSNKVLDTDQKALEINLDKMIYGTFAEIGAGQEVARIFFKVGAAAGTIAKSMSAYDKIFSDKIYGAEESGRYVCESRVYKMLQHECDLLQERLQDSKMDHTFFVFADTIAALNYQRTIKGNGWLGVRFQLRPDGPFNDLVLHVRMLDNTTQLQQSAIGTLGVNMIYACFHHHQDPERFLKSLMDDLHKRIKIDLVHLDGPDFGHIDKRVLTLMAVQNGLSDVMMFSPQGKAIHASEFLYKRSLMVVRGNFRPPTNVTLDVFNKSFTQFCNSEGVDPERAELVAELTLEKLGADGRINYDDFLARAQLLAALGVKVIVSGCTDHQSLVNYLSDFKIRKLGIVIGVRELAFMISENYENHKDGTLLAAFGQLFTKNIQVFAYPALFDNMKDLMTIKNLPVPKEIGFLVKFLADNELIVPVEDATLDKLNILPNNIYNMIRSNQPGWEEAVPKELVELIKTKNLFGYAKQKFQFEY